MAGARDGTFQRASHRFPRGLVPWIIKEIAAPRSPRNRVPAGAARLNAAFHREQLFRFNRRIRLEGLKGRDHPVRIARGVLASTLFRLWYSTRIELVPDEAITGFGQTLAYLLGKARPPTVQSDFRKWNWGTTSGRNIAADR
jgi:hypothetical protein